MPCNVGDHIDMENSDVNISWFHVTKKINNKYLKKWKETGTKEIW